MLPGARVGAVKAVPRPLAATIRSCVHRLFDPPRRAFAR